jgi:drug/metabolite transporter (DMT)-like permease
MKNVSGPESKQYLNLQDGAILFFVTFLWGIHYLSIKFVSEGISPVFAATVRSGIGAFCGVLYCLRKKQPLFHTDILLFHGVMVGLLLGLEFACIFFGMRYTDAGRSAIFVYLHPFVVALGAHFFLEDDRLTFLKVAGLIIAFAGVFIVFEGRPRSAKPTMIIGDILELMAGFLWGATTLYIKKYMGDRVHPINTFLYQLVFSIPILLAISLLLEPRWITNLNGFILGNVAFQGFIVAFLSLFIWFKLIHKYTVTRLAAFTFFTPIFGVLSGVLFLGEEFTTSLLIGLPLVCLGIFLVNWRRP